jgi:hypothetical protein
VASSNVAEAFTLNFNPYNLAYGKTMAASSAMQPAALAADAGAGSRWESEYNDAQWLSVDLGQKQKIQTVVLKWEVACAKEYTIEISDDGKTWKTVHTTTQGNGGTEEITFKPVSTRYVRMQGIKRATQFGYSLYELEVYGQHRTSPDMTPLHFIRLELTDANGTPVSDNFYWRNGEKDLDYTPLNTLPAADITCTLRGKETGKLRVTIKNNAQTVAFGNRLRLVKQNTQERILPVILSDNYITLMPGEEKHLTIEADATQLQGGVDILLKQYGHPEQKKLTVE